MSLTARSLRSFLTLLVAVAAALVMLAPSPAEAQSSTRDLERDFHALVNVERAKEGLGALQSRSDIVSVARGHSQTMADQWRLHHNPSFSSQITGWQRVSENVGYGPSAERIHQALMNSDGHRRNILDDSVTEIGIGVVVKDGRVWVTQNFRRPSSGLTESPPSSTRFGDVASDSVHAASIETITDRGVVDACGSARYCPSLAVTRGQFATMLVKALELPAGSDTSRFEDVSGAVASDIEALAEAGLTNGCTTDRFCPDTRLTREQMATFFARALKLEPTGSPFGDVSSAHDGSVGALYREGIVNGCTSTAFCSRNDVTRAQTASMLSRHLS